MKETNLLSASAARSLAIVARLGSEPSGMTIHSIKLVGQAIERY
jgi:hypothetical protein